MPHNMLNHSRAITRVNDKLKAAVVADLSKWSLEAILKDQTVVIQGILDMLVSVIAPILKEAIAEGEITGKQILAEIGGEPDSDSGVNFQALANAVLNELHANATLAGKRFIEDLQLSIAKQRASGLSEQAILEAIKLDWLKENRGVISSRIWAGLKNAATGAATQLIQLASLSVRNGQQIQVNG